MALSPPFRLQRAQRTIRIARGMLTEAAQACPDLRPELEAAAARALAAERKSAALLKERMN